MEVKMADISKKDNSELQKDQEFTKNLNKGKNSTAGKDDSQKNSILFYVLTIVAALLIVVLIIGGAFFFAIKNNVNGIADSMRDTIEKIPVLSMALPAKPEPNDEKNMTEEQVRQKYTELKTEKDVLEKKAEELSQQVETINKQISSKDTNSALLQKQKEEAEKAQQKQVTEYANLKKDFDELTAVIAKGDPAEYKKYFEKIDPAIAADLYEKILTDQKMSDDVKKYVSIYENMDASAVSGVMEQMGTGKMSLILEIMKNLKKETSAEILTEMTPEFAAKVSEQLAKVYNVGTANSTK
jgi:flagellar motility protein MotE (MotC chaperone)